MKQDERSDEQLHEAMKAGEPNAGALLYDRHYFAIRGFFLNKAAAAAAADELAQEVFVVLLRKPENFRADSGLRSYLFGVAHKVLLAHLRKEKRRMARRGDPDIDVEDCVVSDIGPGVSTLVARKAEAQRLIEALRKIPVKYQSLFEMYHLQDLSAGELARIFDCPIGTIRGRLRLARKALIEALELQRSSFGELMRSRRDVEAWSREVRELFKPEDS